MAWIRAGYGVASYPVGKAIINLTLSQEFVGETVTCTDGTTTITVVPISTTELIEINNLGIWTINCTVDGFTFSKDVLVGGLRTYDVALEYYIYTYNVTYPSNGTCKIYNYTSGSKEEIYTAPSSANGNYSFKLHQKNISYRLETSVDGLKKTSDFSSSSVSGASASVTVPWGTINVTLDSRFIGNTIKCVKSSDQATKTASSTSLTFRVNYIGTWTLSTMYNGLSYTKKVSVTSLTDPVNVSFAPVDLYSFSSATDSQLADMLNAYYNGEIELSHIQSVWNIGDTRTIPLDPMSATGVGEAHRGQNVQIQILDFEHDILTTPINGKEKALITVDLKNCLRNATVTDTTGINNTENGYINSTSTNAGGWHSCARRTWCNEVFYNSLPSSIKTHIKNVDKYTNSKTPSTTVVSTLFPNRAPYSNNEKFSYHITTDLTGPIYITLDSRSNTESSSYDYFMLYIKDGDKYKESQKIGGSGIGKTYKIDSNEFWLYWRSDSSQDSSSNGYWGWRINSITSTEPSTYTTLTWTAGKNLGEDMPDGTTEGAYTNTELSLPSSMVIDSDKVFLLSEAEVFGSTTYGTLGEGNEYAWYAQTPTNRYKMPGWTSAYSNSCIWWERSIYLDSSDSFCFVNSIGESYGDKSAYARGIAPAFCL